MLKRLNHILALIENSFAIIFLFLLLSLPLIQIILRNSGTNSIFWLDSASRVLVLWVALMGSVIASRNYQHIKIDAFSYFFKESKFNKIILKVINITAFLICAIIFYFSYGFILEEYKSGVIAFANVPVWATELIIPISFGLMAFHYLISFVTKQKDDL